MILELFPHRMSYSLWCPYFKWHNNTGLNFFLVFSDKKMAYLSPSDLVPSLQNYKSTPVDGQVEFHKPWAHCKSNPHM